MMDILDEKNHVFNIRLAKLIGLYQILDPGTVKCRGKNIYHIIVALIMLYSCIISTLLNVSGLYYWKFNLSLSIDYFWKAQSVVLVCYKMWIVVHHSNDLWNCLSITFYGFTSFSHRKRHKILGGCRRRSVWLTTMFTITYFSSIVLYVSSTLICSKELITIKNNDGSFMHYRQNALNFYLIVSDETYNAHYNTFYIVEAFSFVLLTILFIIFDVLLVTLCLAVGCQMKVVCTAFKSLGHKSFHNSHSLIDYKDEKKKISNENDLLYDELKTIVMDHQSVMKKYEDFLTLFGRIMLVQIVVTSFSLIVIWFIFIMSFSDVDRFMDSDVTKVKIFCSIPALSFHIYMECYLFGNLHNQKDSIVFALYSSNWTEMDLRRKKMILLTMKMNNAHNKKLKFTTTKIVNLEMFFKTMGDCYTVISVLINYIKSMNE